MSSSKKKKKGEFLVAICNKTGDLLPYVDSYYYREAVEGQREVWGHLDYTYFKPEPFDALLQIVDFTRGRSAANLILQNVVTGAKFPVFMTDIVPTVSQGVNIGGIIDGRWMYVKRGANFGIKLVERY